VKDIRVIGLMVGLEVENNGPEIVSKMRDQGILINCTAEKVLRFLPPLIVQEKEIDYLIQALDKIFKEIN
jgi:acetylornithine/succinyldiaminopimelate/putrescine aminotransferase